jgi:hypothetical protein
VHQALAYERRALSFLFYFMGSPKIRQAPDGNQFSKSCDDHSAGGIAVGEFCPQRHGCAQHVPPAELSFVGCGCPFGTEAVMA